MLLSKQELQIMQPFIENRVVKITASEIAKIYTIPQKTVYNFLEKLTKQYILKTETQGRNKLYSWNHINSELVKHTICTIEHQRTIEFYQRHPSVKHIIYKIAPYVKGWLVVFGSYAKGYETEDSDVDICIVGTYNKEKVSENLKIFNKEIQIIAQKSFNRDPLTIEIEKGHIIAKGCDQFVDSIEKWYQ